MLAALGSGWRSRLRFLLVAELFLLFPSIAASDPKWKFLVFSDSQDPAGLNGVNTTLLAEIVQVVTNAKPAFVLFGGDLSTYASAAAFQTWTNTMGPVYQAGIPVYAALGNHDCLELPAYLEVLGPTLPDNGQPGEQRLTYSVAYSNALVLVLNTFSAANPSQVDQAWVDAVLATNTRPHVFVMGHSLAFRMYHSDSLGDYPTARDRFWNSLSNAHCRIYFCGHDHFYDHARLDDQDPSPENDVHQIVAGTTAAVLYPDWGYTGLNDSWTPMRIWHEQMQGYVEVEVDADRVTLSRHQRSSAGRYETVTDVFTYSSVPTPKLWYRRAAESVTLSWPANGILQIATQADGPYSDMRGTISPYVLTNRSEIYGFYRVRWP